MGTTPISTLGVNVINRLEEVNPPVFWMLQAEIYTALVEAINDLLILVGRPAISPVIPFTLTPNSVWQTLPSGLFLITDIQSAGKQLRKVSLYSMDYVQSSWGSDWETDVALAPQRWFPVGLTRFGIHPAVSTPLSVTLTGIPYPVTSAWPYNGSQTVPFHDEFFQALELYATHYCRLKETGLEADEAIQLFDQYMKLAERLTEIEDRKDPLLFSRSWGGKTGLNPIQKR